VATGKVIGQPIGIVLAEPAEVDDARDAGPLGGDSSALGAISIGLLEVARVSHRVDQVVDDIDPAQGGVE